MEVIDDEHFPGGDSSSSAEQAPVDPLGPFLRDRLTRMNVNTQKFATTRNFFLASMGKIAPETDIIAIHKNDLFGSKRLKAFQFLADGVRHKNSANPNVVRCFFVAATADEASRISAFGFANIGDLGLRMIPPRFLADKVAQVEADEHGLRHVVMCRAILGRAEAVPWVPRQIRPGSIEFDSAVDSPLLPRRYIIWDCYANTHTSRDYVISFTAPIGQHISEIRRNRPSTPLAPQLNYAALINVVSTFLRPPDSEVLQQALDDFQGNRISAGVLIGRIRGLMGENLLDGIVRTYGQRFQNGGGN